MRYRLSETAITLLTINASTFERYRYNKLRLLRIVIVIIHVVIGKEKLNLSFTITISPGSLPRQGIYQGNVKVQGMCIFFLIMPSHIVWISGRFKMVYIDGAYDSKG